jgi:hypothetical protein
VIYFWIIPADVAGTWRWTIPENNSGMNYEIELRQKFNQVWAFQNLGSSKKSIEDFQLRGNKLSFSLKENRGGKDRVMLFEGQVNGNNLFGTVALRQEEKKEKKIWKARRLPSALTIKK